MRPLIVIIKPMVFCYTTGVSHTHEPVHIQAFIPELAVETLHVGIIDRFPRANEMKLNPTLIRPCIQGVADKLGAVVHNNAFWKSSNSRYQA